MSLTKVLFGLLSVAALALAQEPIPISSTGQGRTGGQTDLHYTYSLQNKSGATITGNAVVLSPGNVAVQWATPPAGSAWVSTCDAIATLSCLPGGSSAYNLPVNVTYTTKFSMEGLDPLRASLTVTWTADDCSGTVTLNGKPVDSGLGCGQWGNLHTFTVTSGFVEDTNTLSFTTTNNDNGYEGIVVSVSGTANPIDAAQVSYAANLGAGSSIIDLTNAGSLNGTEPASNLCADVYVFAEDQQLIACCACELTPNHLQTLSVQSDLISNTLTPGVPIGITTMLVATSAGSSGCDASHPGTLSPGLRAWSTTLHAAPSGGFAVTENHFQFSSLSSSEFARISQLCGFIHANGSGYGICGSCRPGAAGAAKQ